MTSPRVAVVQMQSGADVAANLASAERLIGEAAAKGAALALLPENFAGMGSGPTRHAHAEAPGDGPLQRALGAAARRHGLWLVAGTLPLRTDGGRVRAASLVFDPSGAQVARYDKLHLFDVDVPEGESHRESAAIEPGEGSTVVDTPVGMLGLSVCYDLRFPELYRELTARGATLLMVPAAFTATTGAAHWEVLLRARAIEDQCYVLAAAQHGEHPGGRRTHGDSMIVDPWGKVLARQAAGEGVVCADIDPAGLVGLRRSFPVLVHRRLQ
jgi:predicted amidohydrolase